MALSDAATVALARGLWPDLTTAAASDAFLIAWVPFARALASETQFGAAYDMAVAHLVAHAAYRLDPNRKLRTGGASAAGAVKSSATGRLSGSIGNAAESASGNVEKQLLQTAPGQVFLSLRDVQAAIIAPFVV